MAIIECVESGNTKILKKDLFSRMLSTSWYTVNYFNVSFGFQDLIHRSVKDITVIENLKIDESKSEVFEKIKNSSNIATNILLNHFDKNVPHWFLSPWYPSKNRKEIYDLSLSNINNPIYFLSKEFIEVNPSWIDYLTLNSRIIKNFILWNLSLFLQIRNPNVPDIPNKLIKPATRNSLTKQRKFWENIFNEFGSIECIYTGEKLSKNNFHVEHFVPYSFVSHDQIWNLVPVDPKFNMSKSNKLPILDTHFEPFYNLQNLALKFYLEMKPREVLLQEYFYIDSNFKKGISKEKYLSVINPLVTIANNNGFQFM